MAVSVLDREMYTPGEAARLLSIPTSTLSWWLHGGVRDGKRYAPVLRSEPAPERLMTWAEFVEARLLRGYRQADVSMQRLRPFIEMLREKLDIPYPLADRRPYIDDQRKLVYDIQKDSDLDEGLYLVHPEDGQLQLAPPVLDFLKVVEFDEESQAIAIRPLGASSPIRIDPEYRFGQPQIAGIRVESLIESVEAESIEAAARAWDVDAGVIGEALRWRDCVAA